MNKTALLYWPKGGSVERCAQKINQNISNLTFWCVDEVKPEELTQFDTIIMGGSTVGADHWGNNENQNEWTFFFSELAQTDIDLSGKKVALFGLGNQVLYPDHFVDDMMVMHENMAQYQVQFIGQWPTEEYEFSNSEAIVDDKFVGLVLDEDIQPEMTDDRIRNWVKQLNI